MENMKVVGAIMKASKAFGQPGPGPEGSGKGPDPEKKFLMMLDILQPEQPVPLVGKIAGLVPPVAYEVAKKYADQGLVIAKDVEGRGGHPGVVVTISDAGKALLASEREEHMKKLDEARAKHIKECDEKLAVLSDEEKETLVAILSKLASEC